MRTIDLRSDTVTLPTPEMREAMANAELGDNVFREDPTVNRLDNTCNYPSTFSMTHQYGPKYSNLIS